MIHLQATDAQVRALLPGRTKSRKSWLDRAKDVNDQSWKADSLKGLKNLWSEVKPALMEVQRDKCAYCERRLAVGRKALLECDVEHFRPKANCRTWQPADAVRKIHGGVKQGRARGYAWLAHSLPNLLVSCKTCNFSDEVGPVPDCWHCHACARSHRPRPQGTAAADSSAPGES